MNQNIIFFSTFMMLGASLVNATEQEERVSALKQQYISCLGTSYQSREAACRSIYEQLQRQQTQVETQPTIVFDKNQVQRAEAEARRQERNAWERRQQLERSPVADSSRNSQKTHSPTTVPAEPKSSVNDSIAYEIMQERQACERVRSREECFKIANERYQAAQGQSTSSVASHGSSESSLESESSYRNSRYSSTDSSTYRSSNTTNSLPEKTSYEAEHSKMQVEAPQSSGIRKPQELRKPEGIREPQELRKPQPLGQRENVFSGNTSYDNELYKMQNR